MTLRSQKTLCGLPTSLPAYSERIKHEDIIEHNAYEAHPWADPNIHEFHTGTAIQIFHRAQSTPEPPGNAIVLYRIEDTERANFTAFSLQHTAGLPNSSLRSFVRRVFNMRRCSSIYTDTSIAKS